MASNDVLLTDSEEAEEVADLALELHNDFRSDHGSPPMTLDLKLCKEAEAYAVCLVNGTKPPASETSNIGRNIYRIQTSPLDYVYKVTHAGEAVREAVNAWYAYSRDYNWNDPVSSPATAKQFSQLLWKSSKNLGVGVASCGEIGVDFQTVVITIYSPAGNAVSNQKYAENVGPKCSRVP